MGIEKREYGKESDKGNITIQELYNILKNEVENKNNGDCRIEFYLKIPSGNSYDLSSYFEIKQFHVIPDLVFTFEIADYCLKDIKEEFKHE